MKNIIPLSLGILNRLEISNALIPYATVARNSVTTKSDIKFGYLRAIDRIRLDELVPVIDAELPYSVLLASAFLPWNHIMRRSYNYSPPILKINLSKLIANKPNFLTPYKK